MSAPGEIMDDGFMNGAERFPFPAMSVCEDRYDIGADFIADAREGWRSRVELNGRDVSGICREIHFLAERPIAIVVLPTDDAGNPLILRDRVVTAMCVGNISVSELRRVDEWVAAPQNATACDTSDASACGPSSESSAPPTPPRSASAKHSTVASTALIASWRRALRTRATVRIYRVVMDDGRTPRGWAEPLDRSTEGPDAEGRVFERIDRALHQECVAGPSGIRERPRAVWRSLSVQAWDEIGQTLPVVFGEIRPDARVYVIPPNADTRRSDISALSDTDLLSRLAEIDGTNTPANALVEEIINRGMPVPTGSYRMVPPPPGIVFADPPHRHQPAHGRGRQHGQGTGRPRPRQR